MTHLVEIAPCGRQSPVNHGVWRPGDAESGPVGAHNGMLTRGVRVFLSAGWRYEFIGIQIPNHWLEDENMHRELRTIQNRTDGRHPGYGEG